MKKPKRAPKTDRGNTRDPADPELADRLTRLRKRAEDYGFEVSNADIGRAVGLTDSGVGKWFRSGTVARQRIADLCRAIHCSADELFGLVPIGDKPTPYVTVERLATAILVVEESARLFGRKYSPAEKARLLLNYLHSSPGEGDNKTG
jgi:hypothetical protein